MKSILLDPHGDDAVLFACYTLLRYKPHVLVPDCTVPPEELAAAMKIIGCGFSIGVSEIWEDEPFLLIAPAHEDEGHDEHNAVADVADRMHGIPRISYLTYAPRGQRSHDGTEVVPTAREIALKLRALSMFESQIENSKTRPWFYELLDLREWVTE